jgi:hypothetical protein
MQRRRIAALLLIGAIAACGRNKDVATQDIDAVLAAHTDSLLTLPGVVGTAVGLCDGERCIKVLVADSNADTRRRIPDKLEGYRVVIEVTGIIRPR